ncbi:hypothetical protein [Rosenbergiella metrosideri]|uniref:hypothetical protein n=1 Tax=Rosenbergiella metrosideri TaxID=2921185 RepID=UPI001F4F78FD|nr:hypothetical protein [Rosenbergiella metrosideri]
MYKGWFVGNFLPSVCLTQDFEIAVKHYHVGDYEKPHTHKIATEITVIIEGEAEMKKEKYKKGDIVTIFPGEETDFYALTNVTTVVVKYPSVKDDKYLSEE